MIPWPGQGGHFQQGTCQSNNIKANFQVGGRRGKEGL